MKQDNKFVRALIQNAQNSKIVSLEELFRMNIDRIYSIVIRMTANKSLASLIGVNVLIKVWKGIKEFPNDTTFEDWMIRIAIKTTFKELKTGKLVKEKNLQKQIDSESGVEAFLAVPLEKAISELNYESRSSIVMNRIEQLSFNEITELTGMSEDETKENLIKGIEAISRVFIEIEPGTSAMQIEDLPKEIEPDRDIVQFTIDKIREKKEEEFKEEDVKFEEIENLPKREIKFPKKPPEKREFKLNKKYLVVGIILIAIIVSVYFLTLSSNVWRLSAETGIVKLNNVPVTESVIVAEDDEITTESSSSAIIDIENLGKIEIGPGSLLKRLEESNTAKLVSGKLNISTSSTDEYLFIEIPSAVVEEYYLSTDYSISMDQPGIVVVEAASGWLKIVSGDKVSILPEGYSVKVITGVGLGIPVYNESSFSLSSLLEEYLFAGRNIGVLTSILDVSEKTGAITLWNLLQRVIPGHRGLVYDKLNNLVPHPEGVSKEGVLDLKDDMLQLWLEEIEWTM
jgi:RNA polymerase sigma-70 factor (ECF subfamily)